jgi:hypothetical protein
MGNNMDREKLLEKIADSTENLRSIREIVDLSECVGERRFSIGQAECLLAQYVEITHIRRLTALYLESAEDDPEIEKDTREVLGGVNAEYSDFKEMYGEVLVEALASVGRG